MIGAPSDGTDKTITVIDGSGVIIAGRRKRRMAKKKKTHSLKWLQKNAKSHNLIGYKK